MNRLPGTVLLVACAAVTLVVGVMGCRGGGKTIAGTSLVIDFELPQDTPESTGGLYCNGARSIVLAIDEQVGGDPFTHVLLLDTSYRLYGCGGDAQPCNRGITVQHDFTPPTRVVAEWVDVAPEEYAAGPSNVICRGLYDAASNMGRLGTASGPGGSDVITVTIPLLRVGAMNGYFSEFSPGMQPTGTFLGVSPLVQATDLLLVNGTLRDDEGGKILAAGGLVGGAAQTGVYVFEPDNLGFTGLPGASLPVGRAALSATAFATGATDHFVLLAGGAGNDMLALSTTGSWIFTGDDVSGALLTGPAMKSPRAHHAATHVDGIADGSSLREGIVMLGGCNLDGSGTTRTANDVEVFLPSIALDAAFTCRAPTNGGVFCRRSALPAPPQLCQFSVGPVDRIDTADETILWIGGGGEAGSPNLPGSRDLDRTLQTTSARPPAVGFPGLRGSATASTIAPNSFLVVGGDLAPFGSVPVPTTDVFFVSGVTNLTPKRIANLNQARAFPTATRLLDQRLLVAGGIDPSGQPAATYEIGAALGTSLQFTFESVLGGPTCDSGGAGTNCSAMNTPRAAHSAEMIRGSATWLNGSVVLVGGSDAALPEIYVPAYACDATGFLPIAIVGGTETVISDEVDFCDRGRTALGPLMDPSTGFSD